MALINIFRCGCSGEIRKLERLMANGFDAIEARLDAAVAALEAKIDELKAKIDAGGLTAEEEAAEQAELDSLVSRVEAAVQR